MAKHSAVDIQLMRIPDQFDEDAQSNLGAVADLVKASREYVWGTSELCNDAYEIFQDLTDPYERVNILGAYLDGRLVGRAEVRMPLIASTDVAQIVVDVDPNATQEGIGRALLSAAEQVAFSESRRVIRLLSEHPVSDRSQATSAGDGSLAASTGQDEPQGEDVQWIEAADGSGWLPGSHRQARFPLHAGYRLQTVSAFAMLSVPLPQDRLDRINTSLRALPLNDHYQLHTWVGSAPEELLEPLARLHARLPSDSFVSPILEDPDPWDGERVRRTESLREASGEISLMAVAENKRTGALVGMTELVVAQGQETMALQDETLVVHEHRGRRLGMYLKLANLEQLARVAPQVRTVYSWTHSGNDRMNWVNAQLGFKEAGQSAVWVQDFSV